MSESSVLGEFPPAYTALERAQLVTERAATVGFDWSEPAEVLAKIDEELREVKDAMREGDEAHVREEIGDLLFAVVNLARKLGLDAEASLHGTNRKFATRFAYIESAVRARGGRLEETSLEEMESLWSEAKSREG